jgi:hypothetical protein
MSTTLVVTAPLSSLLEQAALCADQSMHKVHTQYLADATIKKTSICRTASDHNT